MLSPSTCDGLGTTIKWDGRGAHRACFGGRRGEMPRDAAPALLADGTRRQRAAHGAAGRQRRVGRGRRRDARGGAGRGVVRGGGARRERERPGRGRGGRARLGGPRAADAEAGRVGDARGRAAIKRIGVARRWARPMAPSWARSSRQRPSYRRSI